MRKKWRPSSYYSDDATETQHQGTGHLAVRDTLPRRLLTLLALKTTARLYSRDGPCRPISKPLIVKKSPFTHLTEAATLQFVAAHTAVPVPRVRCAFVRKNRAYLVMERLPGVTFAEAWPKLSAAQVTAVFKQLRAMLAELGALPSPPAGGVQSCVGGSLRDSRIARSRPRFGPFPDTQAFHLWLREGLRPEEHPERDDAGDQDWQDLKAMAARQDGPWPALVFTHGDLNPFNIFVHEGRVVGIIDWGFAGWYPPYWEYTAAWYRNSIRKAWQDVLPEFLDTFPEELEMEITRQKWYGDF